MAAVTVAVVHGAFRWREGLRGGTHVLVRKRGKVILIERTNPADKGQRQLGGCLCAKREKQQHRISVVVAASVPAGGPLHPHSTATNSIGGCMVPCKDKGSG